MEEASDGPAYSRASTLRPRVAHALGLIAASLLTALLTWLAWQGYRQPEFLLDIANAMSLC